MPHDLRPSCTATKNRFELFQDRCQELGLSAWRCDDRGSMIATPDGSGLIGAWLGSSALRPHITRTVRVWIDTPTPEVVEFFPGCWFLPVIDRQQSTRDQITVVLAMGRPALEQEWFEIICAGAALDVADTRHAFDHRARYGPSDLEGLTKILHWTQQDLSKIDLGQRAINEFSQKLIQAYEETNLLFKLARYLNRIAVPRDMIDTACRQICQIMPFRWTAIQFKHSSDVAHDLDGCLFLAGDLPCDRDAFRQAADQLLAHTSTDNWTRLLQPDKDALASMVDSEVVLEPITHDDTVIGGLLAGNKQGPDPDVSSVETQFLDATADFLGVFHQNASRFAQQQLMFMGTLRALTASVDAKDTYTRGHSERVAMLGYQLAAAMGMDQTNAQRVKIAGLVHDVGKIGVPEAVLCKRGRLTAEEFELMKKHPMIGYNILKDIPPMQDVLPGVLCHHERWDGKGYPQGLSTSNIPLYGRILALADTFDAMSSNRSYRSALPRPDVLNEIERCAGTQFDPTLADVFLTLDFAEYDQLILCHKTQV